MIKIKGDRGTGKTTRLIEIAHENNAIIVVPTYQRVNVILDMEKEMGYKFREIPVIHIGTLLGYFRSGFKVGGQKFVIDEIDDLLAYMGVIAYTGYEKPPECIMTVSNKSSEK